MKISVACEHNIQIHNDPALLFSIMENLLLNAFQAQEEPNMVQIDAGQDKNNNQAQIRITDNGPGIAESLLPDILFEPFNTSKKDGSGIGLWQVKRMITSFWGDYFCEEQHCCWCTVCDCYTTGSRTGWYE